MRRLLALATLMAFMPVANAQDKAKADMSHNGEYRIRYWWTQNPGGDEKEKGSDSEFDHRFKLGMGYKANEKVSANITLLHWAQWGQGAGAGETTGENDYATSSAATAGEHDQNLISVNQAYANWMASDDLTFKIGRQNFQIGDGSLMGINDWENTPYSFEGIVASWEAEFGRFQGFGFKYKDLSGSTSASKDPEHNAYGINFDLKTMPEWLKGVNAHVIKDAADAVSGAGDTSPYSTEANNGQDMLRWGLNASFEFSIVDLKVWYETHSGKYKNRAANETITEIDGKGNMMQAELGAKFDNFMKSRVFVVYHKDSGDSDTTATGQNDYETYDSYFYEKHENAGLMDILEWGNLTYITLGWTFMPGDMTTVGVMYHMFTRTEDGAKADGPRSGVMGTELNTAGAGGTFGTSDKLGDEIDLWAEHKYDGGLATVARLGYFMPGSYYKDYKVGTTESSRDDKILQVMLEGRLSF